jgi:hypothetical protein
MDEMKDGIFKQSWSRRNFLKSTAALAFAQAARGTALAPAGARKNGKIFAYA